MLGRENIKIRHTINCCETFSETLLVFVVRWSRDEFVVAVVPTGEEDKNDQWMGVSVVSQATYDGRALVSIGKIPYGAL